MGFMNVKSRQELVKKDSTPYAQRNRKSRGLKIHSKNMFDGTPNKQILRNFTTFITIFVELCI